jgi:hypothetical protein
MHIQVINYPRTALMSPSLGAWSLVISSILSPFPPVPRFLSFLSCLVEDTPYGEGKGQIGII